MTTNPYLSRYGDDSRGHKEKMLLFKVRAINSSTTLVSKRSRVIFELRMFSTQRMQLERNELFDNKGF